MAKAKFDLDKKLSVLQSSENPNQKRIVKLKKRIRAGDNKPHESLERRQERLMNRLESKQADGVKGNAKQLKGRLKSIASRIDMEEGKPKQKPKPTMKRPKTLRDGFGRY